jgi:hypothetical protein
MNGFISICLDESRKLLNDYITSGYDFMGWRGESLYFALRDSQGGILNQVWFDIQTLPEQLKMSLKCFSDNELIYFLSGGCGVFAKLKGMGSLLKALKII